MAGSLNENVKLLCGFLTTSIRKLAGILARVAVASCRQPEPDGNEGAQRSVAADAAEGEPEMSAPMQTTASTRRGINRYCMIYLILIALAGWALVSCDLDPLVLTVPNIAN